jgi:(E)-4-hydroxy-3-methylbut-2-enyl-diphosphate synthase
MPRRRRVSKAIYVGDVKVGGDAPVSVQSMTKTDTRDVAATVSYSVLVKSTEGRQ